MSKQHQSPALALQHVPQSSENPRTVGSTEQMQLLQLSMGAGGNAFAQQMMRQQLAEQGTSGSPEPYPHRDAIEQETGMDLSGLQAHTDASAQEAARSMGADGFYFDGAVGFDGQPDLELATHEAAHYARRHDGVCLSGEGSEDSGQEQEATALAEDVVSGTQEGAETEEPAVNMENVRNNIGNWTGDLLTDATNKLTELKLELLKKQEQIPEEYSFREAMVDATFGVAGVMMSLVMERSISSAASRLDALFDGAIYSKSQLKGFVSLNITGVLQSQIKSQMAAKGSIEPKILSTEAMVTDFKEAFEGGLKGLLRGARDRSLESSDEGQMAYLEFLKSLQTEDFGAQTRLSALEGYLEVAALASARQRAPVNGGDIGNELFLVEVTAAGAETGFESIKLPAAIPELDREDYLLQSTLRGKRILMVAEDWLSADSSIVEYKTDTRTLRGLSFAKPSQELLALVEKLAPERGEELREALRCAGHIHIDQERTGISIWSEEVFNTFTGNPEQAVDPVSHSHIESGYRPNSEPAAQVNEILRDALGRWFELSLAQAGGLDIPMGQLRGNVKWS